ncbi:MAG: 4Fe-4S binding protein [Candidatus Wallbacteria bacterium]
MSLNYGAMLKPGTSRGNKTGNWRSQRPIFKQEKCTGCTTCERICPEGVVFAQDKKKYSVDLDYCKGCGLCAEECPVKDIEMKMEEK